MASIRKTKKLLKKRDLYAIFDRNIGRDLVITQFDEVKYRKNGIQYTVYGFSTSPFIPYKEMGNIVFYNHK